MTQTAGNGAYPENDAGARALHVHQVSKSFGATKALDSVTICVRAGEILGLLGQNGSGKSTLIKVLAGVHTPDQGQLSIDGEEIPLPVRTDATLRLGMAFVHQDLALLTTLTVMENLFFERFAASSWSPISWSRLWVEASAILESYDFMIDPRQIVGELSSVQRAQLAIIRAAHDLSQGRHAGSKYLILDEPTVFLPRAERKQLFALMRRIVDAGGGAVLVSHDLHDILAVTDRVSVLRDGRVAATTLTSDVTEDDLVDLIVGRRSTVSAQAAPVGNSRPTKEEPVLRASVNGLCSGNLHDFALDIFAGEIIGLTGLAGAGFEDALYLIYGAEPALAGDLVINGESLDIASMTPARSIERGIVLVPSRRLRDGVLVALSGAENVAMPVLRQFRHRGRLHRRAMASHFMSAGRSLDIRPAIPALPVAAFSGGNQQKILIAKWLQLRPHLVLADEPTLGVDVGARRQILDTLTGLAAGGSSVLIASSDHAQLAEVCNRVVVVADGEIASQLVRPRLSEEEIADACLRSRGSRVPPGSKVGICHGD
jgi:ribose transport system ATP-binding protein